MFFTHLVPDSDFSEVGINLSWEWALGQLWTLWKSSPCYFIHALWNLGGAILNLSVSCCDVSCKRG